MRQWADLQNGQDHGKEGSDAARNGPRSYREECNTTTVARNSFPVTWDGFVAF